MQKFLAAGSALCVAMVLSLQASTAAPIISGTYYEDTAYVSCSGRDYCEVLFSPPPQSTAGKLIVLHELGCELNVSAPITLAALYVGDNSGSRRFHPLNAGASGSIGRISFHDTTTFPIAGGPGRTPGAELAFPSGIANADGKCMIIGEIQ